MLNTVVNQFTLLLFLFSPSHMTVEGMGFIPERLLMMMIMMMMMMMMRHVVSL